MMYMTERKILRYNVPMMVTLDATGLFTKTINVPFIPDEVKIKQLCLYLDGKTNGAFSLNCDSLVQQTNSNLGYMIDPSTPFTGITYPLTRSPDGSHTFRVLRSGAVTTALNAAELCVHLEFRKHSL
jgi:hypothetical protein